MLADKKNLIFVIAIFVGVTIFFIVRGGSTGISFDLSNETITMSYSDKYSFSVPVEDIETISLTEDIDLGECLTGEAGKKYSYGTWENTQYGQYQLCSLTKLTTYVVIEDNAGTYYVFNTENADTTTELCDALNRYRDGLSE